MKIHAFVPRRGLPFVIGPFQVARKKVVVVFVGAGMPPEGLRRDAKCRRQRELDAASHARFSGPGFRCCCLQEEQRSAGNPGGLSDASPQRGTRSTGPWL